ncbi:MAG: SocA family protein [Methanobrevibacter sp.]|nr:SocA family protein [Methanobrevibacter sp.]
MNFKKKEYTKLLIHILSHCYDKPHVGRTVITTTLYFVDFNYYELYGKALTNETYLKNKNGIKPKHFDIITEELIEKNMIYFRKEAYFHTTLHKYYLTEIPNIKFSKKKEELIKQSMKHLITKNATGLVKYVSKDPPYQIADFNDEIDYNNVYFRDSKYSVRKKYINL